MLSIFATVSTPKVEARTTSVREWSRTAKNGDVGALANRMQKIPALKASGLALVGDVFTARGQGDAARKGYMESSSIRETPGTTMRIKALDDKGAAKFSPSGAYVAEQARMRDKSIKATPGGDSASMKR